MISDETTEIPTEEEVALSVDTENEDGASLGEISLSRSFESTTKDETPSASKVDVVDPWAQVDVTVDGAAEETFKKSFAERWNFFRNRWTNNCLEDEQAVAVVKPEAPPLLPASPPTPAPQVETLVEATPRRGFSFFKPKPVPPTIDPTTLSSEEMAAFRAKKISVTIQKESRDSKWGFGMDQEGDKVQIKVITGTGLLEHAPFQVGDILVSVNNQKCTRAETTIQELVKMDAGFPITLMVETPQGNPNLVQAMVRKPSATANLGIGFYVPTDLVELKKDDEMDPSPATTPEPTQDKDTTEPDNESTLTTPSEPTQNHGANESDIKPTIDDPNSKLLRINNIDALGLLSHSALSQGDIVVAINATPCSRMSPEEAEALLHQSDDSVSIIAMKPPSQPSTRAQGWLRHAKRAGIAIGGGTLVGVGLIFIPTLPPPFGEVLIVGGVSVLGTEFEAPKRVMRSARDSLERAVGRESVEEKPMEGDGTPVTSETESSDDIDALARDMDKPQPPKKTIGDRFKNFGRRHVLPFLDQVVGDHTEGKKEASLHNAADKTEEVRQEDESNETTEDSLEASVQETSKDGEKFYSC